ncbi:response regulator [Arenibacter sp. S6351L]|uniref:response regulator n=1 Tax=Arenibacter sp. S6351L TaxID=2926407 RepID=UPI001FF22754|nr:response regulator [Arenibacter sp. S6351L]MCK0136095.1 response regulator [Arenibacter sp. S6351L]
MEEGTLWIIDDDMVSQFAMTYKIGQSHPNYRITTFYSVQEALDYLQECREKQIALPHKLLLDLGLPVLSGWDFLVQLEKFNGKANPIDIYIVSSFSNSTDRNRAQRHPLVKDYFNKPLSKSAVDKIFMWC